MVVNTMGWVDGLGYELLLHAVAALRADVVLVVGQDRLYSQLSSELRCVLRWHRPASVQTLLSSTLSWMGMGNV